MFKNSTYFEILLLSQECAICLSSLVEDSLCTTQENVLELNICKHKFHESCLEALYKNAHNQVVWTFCFIHNLKLKNIAMCFVCYFKCFNFSVFFLQSETSSQVNCLFLYWDMSIHILSIVAKLFAMSNM